MKKLVILALTILMLTGCTAVPTAIEYRQNPPQIGYSLPFEICSNGKYTLRKVEYGPGLEVIFDGERHIFDYWQVPAYAEIYDDEYGNIYVCMGKDATSFTEIHVLSLEDGEYVDNMLDFGSDAFKEKIFPHLKVNYDKKNGKLGLSTDMPAYKDKTYAEHTLPYGEEPVEVYYKVPDGGIEAVRDDSNIFTVTFPLEYKVKGTDGGLISKSAFLYAETKVRYSDKRFVIGYTTEDGKMADGFIHVYKAEVQ
ncbi:MAG: hypothetical protein E7432_05240 [Ruminococcaceae bacterium]|nr:hypothetical protein [Oscillospiraceae bacterium]